MKKATQASEGLQKIADLAADSGVAMVTTLDVSSQTLTSSPMMPLAITVARHFNPLRFL